MIQGGLRCRRAGRAVGLMLALCVVAPAAAGAAETDPDAIGFVKTATGGATLLRNGTADPARPGLAVHVADILETGPAGSIGVTFKDDTRIALGPRSRVTIPSFRFAPADHQYGFVIRLLSGTLEYLSGLTAKLAPADMSIQTPTATIGVRGTRLLVRAGA